MEQRPTQAEAKHRAKLRRRVVVLASLGVMLLTVLAALPLTIRWGAVYWLRQHGYPQARIRDVDLNLFTGRLEVSHLAAGTTTPGEALALARFAIQLDWVPFLRRRILIEDVTLRGTHVDLRREDDGSITVGRLKFSTDDAVAPPTTASDGEGWQIRVGDMDLQQVTVHYSDPLVDMNVLVRELQVDPFSSWQPDTPTAFSARIELNRESWNIEGTMTPFAAAPTVDAAVKLEGRLQRRYPRLLTRFGVQELTVDANIDARLSARLDRTQERLRVHYDGTVDLRDLQLASTVGKLRLASANWRGKLSTEGPLASPGAEANGKLQLGELHFTPAGTDATLGHDGLQWEGTVAYDPAGKDGTDGTLQIEADLHANGLHAEGLHPGLTHAEFGELSAAAHPLSVRLSAGDRPLELTHEGKLSLQSIRTRSSFGEVEKANLSWAGTSRLTSAGGTVSASTEGTLESSGARIMAPGLGLALTNDSLSWEGSARFSTAAPEDPPQLGANGELKIGAVSAVNSATDRSVLEWERLDFEGIDLRGLRSGSSARMRIEQLRALQNKPGDTEDAGTHTLVLGQLDVERLALEDGRSVSAKAIRLEDLRVSLTRGENGRFEYKTSLPKLPASAEDAADESEAGELPESEAVLGLLIGEIQIVGESRLSYLDRTVAPPFQFAVQSIKVHVEDVNSTREGQLSPLTLRAKTGRYATISVDGKVGPFAAQPTLQLHAELQGVNLPQATGLAEKYTGYRIKSGLLGADFQVDIEAGHLDSLTEVELSKLKLVKLEPDKEDALSQDLGLPLNTALNLLRDSDDDIHLKIPINGDLGSTRLGIGDAIQKAVLKGTSKAISVGALAYLATLGSGVLLPVGAALAAGKAYRLATALRFEPIPFEPGSAQPTQQAGNQIQSLGNLLQERPKLRLTLCGFATSSDRTQRQQEILAARPKPPSKPTAGGSAGDGKAPTPTPEPAPPPVAAQELLELAQRRGEVVKESLTERFAVKPNRLLVCSPELDESEGATPRVEVSL